ncbi:hypothetical protein chiPu_0024232, partial [Chiloscyllium punctatum]|nr:hypothetical protein [Chiloscyllium punctatum]
EGIPVHRCVLAAFSPFFLQRFSVRDAHPEKVTMELPGLRADTLRALLRFMYTAQIQLPRDETAEAFLRAARGLGVLGLSGGRGTPPGSPAHQGDSSPRAPVDGNARGSETDTKSEAPVVSMQVPGGNARVSENNSKPKAPVVSAQAPGGNARVSENNSKPKAPVVSAQVPSGNARVSETDTKHKAPVVSAQVPGGNARVSETDTKHKAPVVSAQVPGGNARVSENNSKPKAPVVSAQAPGGNARVSENNSKPKATSVTTSSSSPPPRPRGKRAYTPAETPPSTLVTSWRRMRVVRPVSAQSAEEVSVAGESPFPRRQWRRRKGRPTGDPAPPAVPVTDQPPTPPPPVAHPGRDNPSEPGSPEPTEVTAAWPGREGALRSFREPVPSCAPAGLSEQAGWSLAPGEGCPALPRKEAQQTCPAVSGPPPCRAESSGWGSGAVSEQGPPPLAGDNGADREGAGVAARLGKRLSGQGAGPERPKGITKVKLQKVSHSREWVVIPVPEWQVTGLQPHTGNRGRGKGAGVSRRAGRRKASINLTHPPTGLEKNDHRPEGLGGDRRPDGLGGEQGTGGLVWGDDQGIGGLGLGDDQGTGGLGLGDDQGIGGLGLGVREVTGGLGLGVSEGTGGLGLGVDQGSGGLGLGVDQGSGGLGLGDDQGTGGLGLGDDQGTGGLGLGVDQVTGGLGLGDDQGTGGL